MEKTQKIPFIREGKVSKDFLELEKHILEADSLERDVNTYQEMQMPPNR